MSRNARTALLLFAFGLTVVALVLDLSGLATREWWQLALPALVAFVLLFLLIREVRVR